MLRPKYFFNRKEKLIYFLILQFNFTVSVASKYFIQIFGSLNFFLILHYFFNRIKMVIFKDIGFELFQFLIAERASMVPVDYLFDACFAKDMATASDVCIFDRI